MAMKMAVGAITGASKAVSTSTLSHSSRLFPWFKKSFGVNGPGNTRAFSSQPPEGWQYELLKMSQRIEIIEKDMDSFKKSMKSTFEHDKNAVRALILEGQVDGFSQYQATMTTILSVVSTTIIAYQVGEIAGLFR